MRRNKEKTYYVALDKSNNNVKVSKTKLEIAEFLGISTATIRRHLIKRKSKYITDEYTIWNDITINKIKRGFAL